MLVESIGYEAGMNLYAYVQNNPANGRDPLGLDWTAERCEELRGGRSADIARNLDDCLLDCGGWAPV